MKLYYNEKIVDINNKILVDDTIAVFYNKVGSILKKKHNDIQIYTWTELEKSQKPKEVYIHQIIKSMLDSFDSDNILTQEIENYVNENVKCKAKFQLSTAITSQNIITSLMKANPISFKQILNNEDMLIEEYFNTDTPPTFYCIDMKQANTIRNVADTYIENAFDIRNIDLAKSKSDLEYSIAVWNYRFKPLHSMSTKYIDLNDLFTRFSMSYEVPFAKLIKSSEHISLKMNKEFVRETDRKKLRLWSKNNKAYYANSKKDLIVLRIPSPDVGITVIIYPEGYVDIKLNLTNSKSSPQVIMKKLQPTLYKFFDMYDISYLLYDGKVKNIKIKGSMAISKAFTEEFLKSHLNPDIFGYLGRDKKYFEILVKKNSGFYSFQNIQRMINTFKIKLTAATSKIFFPEMTLEKLKEINSTINKTHFYKSNIQDVIIKLKSNRNGVDFYVSGLKYEKELERSLKYIYYIFYKSSEHAPQKNIEKKNTDDDEYVGIFEDDDDDDDEEDDEEEGENQQEFMIGDLSECPPPPSSSEPKKSKEKKSEKYERVHINELKEADAPLFTFSGDKDFGTYAKKCQRSRQPIVLSKSNVDRSKKCFPNGLRNVKQYGSTAELKSKNYYACPPVWCPRSRTAMSLEDFESYGKRCPYPDIDEEPVIKKGYNYVDHFKQTSHPQGYDLPCCFNKPQHPEEKQSTDKPGSAVASTPSKYILDEDWPLPNGRYGIVPKTLEKLFRNKFCGEPSGRQGNIKSGKTNCYVKVGVDRSQPFLSCLAALLDIASWEDITKKLYNEVTFAMFMTTHLYQYFIPSEYDSYRDYSLFRAWYSKQVTYFDTFKISKSLIDEIQLPNQTSPTKSMKNYDNIRREYIFFKSFMRFKDYLKNNGVPKTPEMVLPLFTMFYKINILILDSSKEDVSYINCDSVHSYINPFIVMINNGSFYEYVVHLAADSGKLIETKVFFYEQTEFIQTILSGCFESKLKSSVVSEQSILFHLRDKVEYLVINYDMNVIGVIVNSKQYYPFITERALSLYYNSRYKVVFSTDVKVKKLQKLTREEYKYMNEILNEKYYNSNNIAININETNRDNLLILLGDHDVDDRLLTVNKRDYRYKLFVLVVNEIIKVYDNDKHKHQEVIEFVRHEANPMSYHQKYHHLMTHFKPMFEEIIQKSTINVYPITSSDMTLCSDYSNVNKKDACNRSSYCAYNAAEKICKLKVAKDDYQYLIERVIDYLIYSTNDISQPLRIAPDIIYYDNILISAKNDSEVEKYVNDIQVNVFETSSNIKENVPNSYSNLDKLKGIADIKYESKVSINIVKNIELFEVKSLENLVLSLIPLLGGNSNVKGLKIKEIPTKLNVNVITLTKSGKKTEQEIISVNDLYTYIIFYITKDATYIVRKLNGRAIFRKLDLLL